VTHEDERRKLLEKQRQLDDEQRQLDDQQRQLERLDGLCGVVLQTGLAASGVLFAVAGFASVSHPARILLIVAAVLGAVATTLGLLGLGIDPFVANDHKTWIEKLAGDQGPTSKQLAKKRRYMWWGMALLVIVVVGGTSLPMVVQLSSGSSKQTDCSNQAAKRATHPAAKHPPRTTAAKPASKSTSSC
jgi:hypothetical protein